MPAFPIATCAKPYERWRKFSVCDKKATSSHTIKTLMSQRKLILALFIGLFTVTALSACKRDYYLKPTEGVMPVHQPGDSKLNCQQLDFQIGELQRDVLTLIPPDFTGDAGNQAAMVTGTFLFSPAYLYLLQNELVDKPRQYERIEAMVKRIELLQRYKAQLHCFERR